MEGPSGPGSGREGLLAAAGSPQGDGVRAAQFERVEPDPQPARAVVADPVGGAGLLVAGAAGHLRAAEVGCPLRQLGYLGGR
ncbi:hypothetical protein [Streptomyces sp. NPDC058869]|uniref:hypothetical protein n=1 Tax=Streptomyces sp. NPDC058869 TaxID=3346659 RepID=UPI003681229C